MRTDVYGVGFDNVTLTEALDFATGKISAGDQGYIVTPNPEIVWMCKSDAALKSAVAGASLVLADGVGVIIGAKILGRPLKAKIPGIDFAEALIERLAAQGKSVYLFGAKPGVAEEAGARLCAKYPGLVLAGCSDGYFEDAAPVIEKINAAKPDLLLVCLGAPKQECWMAEKLPQMNAGLAIGLGGALDVFAGVVSRAPKAFRALQLEWLYRLIRDPRRIKRMIKLPLFIFAVIWCRIRGK